MELSKYREIWNIQDKCNLSLNESRLLHLFFKLGTITDNMIQECFNVTPVYAGRLRKELNQKLESKRFYKIDFKFEVSDLKTKNYFLSPL